MKFMNERWETVEEIAAAREGFETALPGWQRPAAFGLGTLDEHGKLEFARVNVGENPLPAVVLATVCGYRNETGSFRLSRKDLTRVIELLSPAEACTAYQHPNLWAWRQLLLNLEMDDEAIAVFIADWDSLGDDPYVDALRKAADR
ncbi:hypothetical protein [Glycomyces buryatensis]|uniref:Uncharacterized protein n=1 Tax=Glycomyces buryatensis TaxID=2570927 RepID=A0A4S8PZ70_9ACTN|nr:hypothetical protein [Glycomyces buryatensis]THV36998.1 hypothetical protein FAB82_20795 [Glycomyces buryatensis]